MRAASIWRDVRRPGSTDCMPKSPKLTSEPRCAVPRLWPFWTFRYLVRLGESIAFSRAFSQKRRGVIASGGAGDDTAGAALQNLALEDPDLDADDSVLGLRLGKAELDVGAERVKR